MRHIEHDIIYSVLVPCNIVRESRSILVTLNAGSGGFPEVGLTTSLQAAANGVATNFNITVTRVQRFG